MILDEVRVWRLMLLGVGTVAGAALITSGLSFAPPTLIDRPDAIRQLIFSLAGVVSCAPIYQALIHWNRTRTRTSDPSDTVNGLSAVLVLAAFGNLVLAQVRPPEHGLTQWQTQASILVCSTLVVVLGTAGSVSVISGLMRDRRLWLIVVALSVVTIAELTAVITGPLAPTVTLLVWLGAGGLIVSCPLMAADTAGPQPATNQATIMGALLVQSLGVVLLAIDNRLGTGHSRLATEYALAGVLGASVRVLQLVRDLSQLAKSRHEALTDELTGIPNRRALLMAIDDALLTTRSASLLIVDLDRFKEINDRYGHAAGDRLLRHTAGAFAVQVPPGAFLSRLGGDEFAVLLTDDESARASDLALRLARAAATPMNDVKGRLLQVGASIGIATVDMPGVEGGELLRRADAAMYQAKTSGSGVRVYDRALDAAAQERLELTEDLRLALRGPNPPADQILVHYQPQLNIATGRVVGVEALVRWQHPRLGLLGPDLFIELAEQNGLMQALTAQVMREATAQTARWRSDGHRLRVSVNLSAGGLAHRSLLPLIDEVLAAGMPAADLVLEVTETSLMKDPALALEAMHRIAARGVGISIDDYGTGYSSLRYMNDLPACELKIDRSFTVRTTTDPRTAAIVAGTVELAHRLGMRLIAEGVEDDETYLMVKALGCDESQGYRHSRPLPAETFLTWLDAHIPVPV
jgi:diguanylate cyclase (GGDEF)-like protein